LTAGCGALAAANLHNLHAVYGILIVACLDISGIVVLASIITTIIYPDDLIATVAALTPAIRVLGVAIGYTTHYNIFYNKFVPKLTTNLILACIENHILNATVIKEIADLTGSSLINDILYLPGVDGNVTI